MEGQKSRGSLRAAPALDLGLDPAARGAAAASGGGGCSGALGGVRWVCVCAAATQAPRESARPGGALWCGSSAPKLSGQARTLARGHPSSRSASRAPRNLGQIGRLSPFLLLPRLPGKRGSRGWVAGMHHWPSTSWETPGSASRCLRCAVGGRQRPRCPGRGLGADDRAPPTPRPDPPSALSAA